MSDVPWIREGLTDMARSKNSNQSPSKLESQGKCDTCGDQGLWTNFNGEQKRVTCPQCGK
jgi:hypothetical protein